MELGNLFEITYWLDTHPFVAFPLKPYLFGFFLVLIILGILSQRYLMTRKSKLFVIGWKRSISALYTIGFWGTLLLFFRHENAPYLSMRLWYLVLLVYLVVVLVLMVKDHKKSRISPRNNKPTIKGKYRKVKKKSKKKKKKK